MGPVLSGRPRALSRKQRGKGLSQQCRQLLEAGKGRSPESSAPADSPGEARLR